MEKVDYVADEDGVDRVAALDDYNKTQVEELNEIPSTQRFPSAAELKVATSREHGLVGMCRKYVIQKGPLCVSN